MTSPSQTGRSEHPNAVGRVPRTVWMLWLQGFDHAPPLVHLCVKSWVRQNPDWTVRCLRREDLPALLGQAFCDNLFGCDLPPQKQANIIRIALVAQHGGVWADADCFCAVPLTDWVDEAARSGFFAFGFGSDTWLLDPSVSRLQRLLARAEDRVLANWFFAGHAQNHIFVTFTRLHLALLIGAARLKPTPLSLFKRPLRRIMRRNPYLSAKMADSRFIARFGFYPYFVFHYHFAATLQTDAVFRDIWLRTGRFPARPALKYSNTLGAAVDDAFKQELNGRGAPVFKFHARNTAALQRKGQTRYEWLQAQFGG